MNNKKEAKLQMIMNIFIFILLPVFLNIVLESLAHKKIFGGFEKLIQEPYIFICNALIIMFTISFGVFMRKRRTFWVCFVSVLWLGAGVTNYLLLCNRITPFTAYDLRLIDALTAIIKKYMSPAVLAMTCLSIVIVVLGLIILFFKVPLKKRSVNLKGALLFFFAVAGLVYGNMRYAVSAQLLETHFAELSKAYLDNGFAYCFSVSIFDNGIRKLDNYSKEYITSITDTTVDTQLTGDSALTPNIIFVQLESFFDINCAKNVTFSENPIPNFTRFLSENPSGLFTVPVIGAGTVNTEFEVVTGMRASDFGAGEYPYKTILTKTTCESIAYNLRSYGYTSHFVHNYSGTFYGRNVVYQNLGYDNFYSIEYMKGYETNVNGWAKDMILTRYINECLDSTKGQDLVTAVSVQGHGSYAGKTDYTKHVFVTSCEDEELRDSYEFYANQLYEMDQFIDELTESLSAREEDTILVVYGDHLPSIDFADEDLSGRHNYQTDYFIWNNMGLDFEQEDIYAYEINSRILNALHIQDGIINSYHQNHKNDAQYGEKLQALEYDILYGERYVYDGKNPYKPSELKLNYRKLTIDNIVKKEGEERIYIVNGSGFSEKTCVRVNGNIAFTHYMDETTLEFKDPGLEEQSSVTVWENGVGSSEPVLFQKK